MQAQVQESSSSEPYSESYFILPVKKQPAVTIPRPLWMPGLLLVTLLIMVSVALALGTWWDSLSNGVQF